MFLNLIQPERGWVWLLSHRKVCETSVHSQSYSVDRDDNNNNNNNNNNTNSCKMCVLRDLEISTASSTTTVCLDKTENGEFYAKTCVYFNWQVICVADEYVMLVKGAETAVLDQLASGPRDITLDHVNEYAVVCRLVCPY